ncbi:MAG: PEP-CTERM sorting domain-containing protein [Leptospirales bacterium]
MYTYTTINDPNATNGTFAFGINGSGAIVGVYSINSGEYGFLATPMVSATPEPSAWLLFGTGILLMGIMTARKQKGLMNKA